MYDPNIIDSSTTIRCHLHLSDFIKHAKNIFSGGTAVKKNQSWRHLVFLRIGKSWACLRFRTRTVTSIFISLHKTIHVEPALQLLFPRKYLSVRWLELFLDFYAVLAPAKWIDINLRKIIAILARHKRFLKTIALQGRIRT